MQSFLERPGTAAEIFSQRSGVLTGYVFRACSSSFCSSVVQGAEFDSAPTAKGMGKFNALSHNTQAMFNVHIEYLEDTLHLQKCIRIQIHKVVTHYQSVLMALRCLR